jgi:hypothetical protein
MGKSKLTFISFSHLEINILKRGEEKKNRAIFQMGYQPFEDCGHWSDTDVM